MTDVSADASVDVPAAAPAAGAAAAVPRPIRSANGRFLPGGPGGPGNPTVAKLQLMQVALRNATTAKDVGKVFRKLRDLALAGDPNACRYYLERACGKPEATLAVDLQHGGAVAIAVDVNMSGPPIPPTQDLVRDIAALHALANELFPPSPVTVAMRSICDAPASAIAGAPQAHETR
jgi:hypothetical protein